MADTMLQIVSTTVVILRILLRMRETAIFPLPACYSLLCAYVRKNFCRTQVVRFFVRVAHDDGILFIERLLQWAYSLSIACLVCQFIFKMIKKHVNLTIWLLVVIISRSFSYLNVHFLWRKLCWKTVVRYVTLKPFDVNYDVIFLFTFYKHRRKQISAVILKPNIEVTFSSTHYRCKNFRSNDSSDRV